MSARNVVLGLLLACVLPWWAVPADAQPIEPVPTVPTPPTPVPAVAEEPVPAPVVDDGILHPVRLESDRCNPEPAATASEGIPTTWADYDIAGDLVDPKDTVRALLDPILQGSHALAASARADIRRAARSFGYHLIELSVQGAKLTVHLAPLPLIRRLDVKVKQSWFDTLFEDEIKRRMRLRIGSSLPWAPEARSCELRLEEKRLQDYLADEGYADAKVKITDDHEHAGVKLELVVTLGEAYKLDLKRLTFAKAAGATAPLIPEAELRAVFKHKGNCVIAGALCFEAQARFTTAQHKADIKTIIEMFQRRGFPAVRVTDNFDTLTQTSFDRRAHKVIVTVTIDPRRQLSVVFEGNDPGSARDDELLQQLTFSQAGSSDEVETADSARAITAFLQGKGFFDARVTWNRERFPELDRIVYRIEQGGQRRVRDIQFVGNHALTNTQLEDAIATKRVKLSNTLFGTTVRTTSPQLAADVERIAAMYYRLGYRDVRVRVSAGTDPAALDSAALAAALLSADRGAGALYARFTIDEGEPTLLAQIRIDLGRNGDAIGNPDDRRLCDQGLKELADLLGDKHFATPVTSNRCIGIAPNVHYRADEVDVNKDKLREKLWNTGRPRARVDLTTTVLSPHRYEAVYKLTNTEQLRMGKVVIRGNFRTRESIVREELRFKEGVLLTADSLAEAARRLRSTGLFDAVTIDLPDLERTSAGEVHAVVRVEERYDYLAAIDVEGGGSTYSGVFAKLTPSFRNLLGLGLSLDLSGTVGFDFAELTNGNAKVRQLTAEATFKIPIFLVRRTLPQVLRPIAFQAELTAFHRLQDTPRFGPVTTEGATVALSRTWSRPRTARHSANALTFGVHYDFRLRERQVDVLRPIGADDDQSQVPISTRTGSVGLAFEWEQRTDRRGALSPLAPEAGFRFESQVSLASPVLFGQDTFIKVSAAGSKYVALGDNLVLRGDLRYDQGIPLGGAVLLPEVERFFAGGDSTVRGYDDERMATEIVQVGIPPLANVDQIRILSAGGNIRVLGSLDAQLRIYKVLATALFFDAGLVTNQWATVNLSDIRPSVGMALLRVVTPFGSLAFERAIPLRPQLGDDPRGRWHISFAARAQF